jgi:hypothetical protein
METVHLVIVFMDFRLPDPAACAAVIPRRTLDVRLALDVRVRMILLWLNVLQMLPPAVFCPTARIAIRRNTIVCLEHAMRRRASVHATRFRIIHVPIKVWRVLPTETTFTSVNKYSPQPWEFMFVFPVF